MRQQLVKEKAQRLASCFLLSEPGSCGEGIFGMSMPLMAVGHLSEPFLDGWFGICPKGVFFTQLYRKQWKAQPVLWSRRIKKSLQFCSSITFH